MLPFDTSSNRLSWANIRACEEAAATAYVSTTIENAKTDTGVRIDERENCIVVAFRGSRNLRDFIQDFKARAEHPRTQTLWANDDLAMEVHTGILENFESVAEELVHTLHLLPAGKPIFVTGHSKGGGEALLAAMELDRNKFTVHNVITFGGLRVLNGIGRVIYDANLRERTFRVVNQNDIVPRLPLWTMGYRHCGQEVFLPVGSGWILNPGLTGKIISDLLGLYGAWRHRADVLVSDHVLGGAYGYFSRIKDL